MVIPITPTDALAGALTEATQGPAVCQVFVDIDHHFHKRWGSGNTEVKDDIE